MKQYCKNCLYFHHENVCSDGEGIMVSECKRYPPVRYSKKWGEESGNLEWMDFEQPLTADDCWCGEWKFDGRS